MLFRSTQLQVLEVLGEGSQGRVHKAIRHDPSSGMSQTVAIKILHSRNAVDLWRQEFESLSQIRSHHCVRVLYFERLWRKPALVMEFVDGLSLHQLSQSARLDDDDVEEIMSQLEAGLRDLHLQGLSHGDLSPQNALVDVNGDVRLLDFGLANGSRQKPRLTPQFAAPERLNGGAATASADLYSLGRLHEYLRRESLIQSPYLRANPELRKWQGLTSLPSRRVQLGGKVRQVQQQMRQAQALGTRTHDESRPVAAPKFRRSRLALLTALIFCFNFAAPSASHSARVVPLGQLIIHTRKWHFIYINGSPVGYAPVSLPVPAGQELRIRWQSADGGGERIVALHAQETQLLKDSDFSH